MYRKISIDDESNIINLIKTKSQKEIASIYKVSQSAISNIMKRRGIKTLNKGRLDMSRLKLNVNFFENIDSQKKAYWLGYICGDGSLNKDYKVTLTSIDFEILDRFKNDIESDHTISHISNFDRRTNKNYTAYTIQIRNYLFCNNIINKGIGINKTDKLLFPDIIEDYYPYFIAGLFDGHLSSVGFHNIIWIYDTIFKHLGICSKWTC